MSSNRAFKKLERCADGRGKGFFWSVDEKFEHIFEEQEAKGQAGRSQDNGGGKDGKSVKKKDKGASLLEPALKRSVKGDLTGAPLPPPLTFAPLIPKSSALTHTPASSTPPSPVTTPLVKSQSSTSSSNPSAQVLGSIPRSTIPGPSSETTTPSSMPPLPPSLYIPIVVGPIPASHPSSSLPAESSNAPLPSTAIVLHEGTLILNPDVFSHLTTEQVKELEALGAQKALEILQGYIARFLKEQRLKKREGERGRGRGRGLPRRNRGTGRKGNEGNFATTQVSSSINGSTDGKAGHLNPGPFTMTPLPPRNLQAQPNPEGDSRQAQDMHPPVNGAVPTIVDIKPPVPIPMMDASVALGDEDTIVVVDDSDSSEVPAAKKRRLDGPSLNVIG